MPIPNDSPYEIIAAPFEVYIAPVGTAFPAIDESPTAPWALVGKNGSLNTTDDGVTIELTQSIEYWRALGSTGPRKAFRTEEMLRISFESADLTLEAIKIALNGNTITDTAAGIDPGTRKIGLSRGLSVTQYALLVRGPSPYIADHYAQWEVPIVVHDGEPEIVSSRGGEPAVVAMEFGAIEDPNAATPDERFGRLIAADEAAAS